MLNDTIRILNFDDSVINQQKLTSFFKAQVLDLRDLGPRARIWLDKQTKHSIQSRIRDSLKNSVTFLGSGDFHHITGLLIEQFREPISVIVFDHHPDWDIMPPKFGCGSWVNRALDNDNVLKVVCLGVSSDDISSFWIQTGNLNSLRSDRVEIYPYVHNPTKVLLKNIPQNRSVQLKKGVFFRQILWQELKSVSLPDFLSQIIKRLSVKQVYVSIDKDCLKSEYSLTNWEEGNFTLDELLSMLRPIKEELDIVGLDITGDYSEPKVCGRIKDISSWLDHPKDYSAKGVTSSVVNSVNEQTNIKILESLIG